jgi:lipoate-protein ligase A
MILIDRTETDPYFNIAAEEYVLKEIDEDVFMLWINQPSVIIGKHQVATAEADIIYTNNNNIPVIRRISGGGTVYHDKGNLNYSLILKGERGKLVDYEKYSGTIIRALAKISVLARLKGKSSLVIEGRKFSGNAEHIFRNKVLHHGTLLYNTDLKILRDCIRPDHADYFDKAIRSNDSQIANLSEFLPKNFLLEDFRALLLRQINEDNPGITEYSFSKHDLEMIQNLAKTKYKSAEWNFSYSPKYELVKKLNIATNNLRLELSTEKGFISKLSFYDQGTEVYKEVSKHLINTLHHPAAVNEQLLGINFESHIINTTRDRFIAELF